MFRRSFIGLILAGLGLLTATKKPPGRVYDSRTGNGFRVFVWSHGAAFRKYNGLETRTIGYGELMGVKRVEFDEDADEGPATVTMIVKASNGRNVRTEDGSALVTVTFKTLCKIQLN